MRQASALTSKLEAALATAPSNAALRLNLSSAHKMMERAEAELQSIAKIEQVDLFKYRIVNAAAESYLLQPVTASLGLFQDVFSYIYDALISGPKQRARLSRGVSDETAMQFGYSFAGSLGVVLIAPSSMSLFGGKFEPSVQALFDLFEVSDDDEVKDAAKILGRAAIQKIYQWSEVNFRAGYDLDLSWVASSDRFRGRYIDANQFAHIADIIGRTSEIETRPINIRGVLVGINTVLRSFHFVEPEGESFKGILADEFPANIEWIVNQRYIADIEEEVVIRYATGDETRRYRLLRLQSLKEVQLPEPPAPPSPPPP